MKAYQLAKLVGWAGTLRTRKRLQKAVFLLKAHGCPLDADYTLHFYGPYSQDLAGLTDNMVQAGLLEEERCANAAGGATFSYRLSDRGRRKLTELEQDQARVERLGNLAEHEVLAKRLLGDIELQDLELAATVAYFHSNHPEEGWGKAREAAAKFKRQQANSATMQAAEVLAREVVGAAT